MYRLDFTWTAPTLPRVPTGCSLLEARGDQTVVLNGRSVAVPHARPAYSVYGLREDLLEFGHVLRADRHMLGCPTEVPSLEKPGEMEPAPPIAIHLFTPTGAVDPAMYKQKYWPRKFYEDSGTWSRRNRTPEDFGAPRPRVEEAPKPRGRRGKEPAPDQTRMDEYL